MNINKREGFTLIEILIVVAIIAILASVVLVGLGPTQQAGRDARRLADLRETQTGLELYFNKCGYYPGGANAGACGAYAQATTFAAMSAALTGSTLGIQNVPNDPSAGKIYYFTSFGGGTTYTLGATLENVNNSVFNGYVPPANVPQNIANNNCTAPNYCTSL